MIAQQLLGAPSNYYALQNHALFPMHTPPGSFILDVLAEETPPPRAPPRTRISHDEYHQFCDETLECMLRGLV